MSAGKTQDHSKHTHAPPLIPPAAALAQLVEHLAVAATEQVSLAAAAGRVLAENAVADRPSPPCDVSAMDGYAVQLADVRAGRLAISAEVLMGCPPPELGPGQAVRVFTGGAVPAAADLVIQREEVIEHGATIDLPATARAVVGMNIRRRGENLQAGEPFAAAGTAITPALSAALATFGVARPLVYKRVRVTLLVTGNELVSVEKSPEPSEIRDSNGAQLEAMLAGVPWVQVVGVHRAPDEHDLIQQAIEQALGTSDAVIITGGVSIGDHDHVPNAVKSAGGTVIFHKVAQRPGMPMLGAAGPRGQFMLGLPGNPVSSLISMRRWGSMALRRLAGFAVTDPPAAMVDLESAGSESLKLWWYRPARLTGAGKALLVKSMGSGDLVAASRADGFIEQPPGNSGPGLRPFYPWTFS